MAKTTGRWLGQMGGLGLGPGNLPIVPDGPQGFPEKFVVPSEARNVSEAIRLALRVLGDVEAPSEKVKEKVLGLFPALCEQVEAVGKNWAAYVTQNRDRAADEMGVVRRKRADASGTWTPTYADYLEAQRLVDEYFGGDAKKACDFLTKLAQQNLDHFRASLQAWHRLVASAGSAETARNVLEVMRQDGTI